MTYSKIIIQFNSSGRIKLNLFQRLPYDVIWLPLALLCGLDSCCLIDISLVIHIKFTESILKAEDLILLKLRVFPEVPETLAPGSRIS